MKGNASAQHSFSGNNLRLKMGVKFVIIIYGKKILPHERVSK